MHTSHNKWCSELWQLKAASSSATKGSAVRRASLQSSGAPAKRASLTGCSPAAKRASVELNTAGATSVSVRNAANKLPAAVAITSAAQCLRNKENDVFTSGWFVG